jgi:hypothetical protein
MIARAARSQDFWTGLIFVLIGSGTAGLARGYNIGDASRMGPGYFPAVLGLLLAALGLLLIFRSLVLGLDRPVEAISFRPMLVLPLSVLVFAIILPVGGLLIANFIAALIVCKAGRDTTLGEMLILAVFLSFLNWLIFVVGLDLTVPVFPMFMRG